MRFLRLLNDPTADSLALHFPEYPLCICDEIILSVYNPYYYVFIEIPRSISRVQNIREVFNFVNEGLLENYHDIERLLARTV